MIFYLTNAFQKSFFTKLSLGCIKGLFHYKCVAVENPLWNVPTPFLFNSWTPLFRCGPPSCTFLNGIALHNSLMNEWISGYITESTIHPAYKSCPKSKHYIVQLCHQWRMTHLILVPLSKLIFPGDGNTITANKSQGAPVINCALTLVLICLSDLIVMEPVANFSLRITWAKPCL